MGIPRVPSIRHVSRSRVGLGPAAVTFRGSLMDELEIESGEDEGAALEVEVLSWRMRMLSLDHTYRGLLRLLSFS